MKFQYIRILEPIDTHTRRMSRSGKVEKRTTQFIKGENVTIVGHTKDLYDPTIYEFILANGWLLTLTDKQFELLK